MGIQHTDALLRCVRRWFDQRTVSNVFEPLLADHQREWLDAPLSGRPWIAVRTAAALLTAVVSVAPRALFLTPTPPSMTRRIVARMILFVSVVTGLTLIPFAIDFRASPFVDGSAFPPARFAEIMFWLLPSSMLLAFPFAMGFIVDGVRRSRTPTPAERVAFLRAAILGAVVMIAFHGWIVPAANQQFRLTVMAEANRPPSRGARELTTLQLFQAPSLARADRIDRREAIQREIHNRASFAVLPVILMWLRWRALNRPSARWLLPAWLAATVTFGAYFVLRWNDARFESALNLEPGAGVWVALAVLLLFGVIRDRTIALFETEEAPRNSAA